MSRAPEAEPLRDMRDDVTAQHRLIHALLKQELQHDEVRKLAEKGNVLVKTLRNRVSSYNRALEKVTD